MHTDSQAFVDNGTVQARVLLEIPPPPNMFRLLGPESRLSSTDMHGNRDRWRRRAVRHLQKGSFAGAFNRQADFAGLFRLWPHQAWWGGACRDG